MTIRQLIIGTAIGATALGTMLHRLTKQSIQDLKPSVTSVVKVLQPRKHAHQRNITDERASFNKHIG